MFDLKKIEDLETLAKEYKKHGTSLNFPLLLKPWLYHDTRHEPRMRISQKNLEGTLHNIIMNRINIAGLGKYKGRMMITIEKVLGIEGRFDEYYEQQPQFDNQAEQLSWIVKSIEKKDPQHFQLNNLMKVHGYDREAASIIRSNAEEIKNINFHQLQKKFFNPDGTKTKAKAAGFAEQAFVYQVELIPYVLRKEKMKQSKNVPTLIIIKPTKTEQSASFKEPRYAALPLPFIKKPTLTEFDPYMPLGLYQAKGEDMINHLTVSTLIEPIGNNYLGMFAKEMYPEWQAKCDEYNNAVKNHANNRHLRKIIREKAAIEEKLLKDLEPHLKGIHERHEDLLNKEEKIDFRKYLALNLMHLNDWRGAKLFFGDEAKIDSYSIGAKLTTTEGYITKSFEDKSTDKSRSTAYNAYHALFQHNHEVFEMHAVQGYQDWLGKDNSILYNLTKEQQKYGHFNEVQSALADNLHQNLLWLSSALQQGFTNVMNMMNRDDWDWDANKYKEKIRKEEAKTYKVLQDTRKL